MIQPKCQIIQPKRDKELDKYSIYSKRPKTGRLDLAFWHSVRFPNLRISDVRSKTGHKRPVIGRPVQSTSGIRLSDVRSQRPKTGCYIRFSDVCDLPDLPSGSKPVLVDSDNWNRFPVTNI